MMEPVINRFATELGVDDSNKAKTTPSNLEEPFAYYQNDHIAGSSACTNE